MDKEVIIFGDGHSIRNYDLSTIDPNIDRIYCGNQAFHKHFNPKLPCKVHYIVVEPRLYWPYYLIDRKRNYLRNIRPIELSLWKKIEESKNIDFYIHWSNFPFVKWIENLTFVSSFHSLFTLKLHNVDGSFNACISLANVLGYKKIHLIGFDSFLLKSSSRNRWYEKECVAIINNTEKAVIEILSAFPDLKFQIVSDSDFFGCEDRIVKSDIVLKRSRCSVKLPDLMAKEDIDLFRKAGNWFVLDI